MSKKLLQYDHIGSFLIRLRWTHNVMSVIPKNPSLWGDDVVTTIQENYDWSVVQVFIRVLDGIRPRRRVPSAGKGFFLNTLIRGGVLRVGSDPIPAVKLLPDPAHLPLKLECLYRVEEATRGIDKFEVGCGMWLVMDGGYEISSASDDEPVRKLFLLLAPDR
jgi:hypothetical protein